MSFKLNHTAQQIDHKLDLINENKNLLEYPYNAGLPAGLEDIGDGSILTSDTTCNTRTVSLQTFSLPVGKKYIVSLVITDIIDASTTVINNGFSLLVQTNDSQYGTNTSHESSNSFSVLDLSTATGEGETRELSGTVVLNIPESFDKGLLIKPQIEEVENGKEEATEWAPHMDKIGTYVDRRFNNTNTKIRVLAKDIRALNENIVTLSTTDITEGSAIDTLFYAVYEE